MALFGRKKTKKDSDDNEIKPQAEAVQEKVGEVEAPKTQLPKGGDEHAYAVILKPLVTEKSSFQNAINKYVFKVAEDSNKFEIKKAIEKMYKVSVIKVAISRLPSKYRRIGRHEGEKSGYKKAIVTLKEGDKIEIS